MQTIEGITPGQGRSCRASKTSLGVSNVSFGVGLPARSVLNSVFLHHCVEAGLDLAMVNPNHITPYAEIPEAERELADDLVFDRRDDALGALFIAHFEGERDRRAVQMRPPPRPTRPRGWSPRKALHFRILRRKEGGSRGVDRRQRPREDRRGPDAQRGALAGDEGGRRQVRRRRADPPAVRAPVPPRVMKRAGRPAQALPGQARGLHQGHGRDPRPCSATCTTSTIHSVNTILTQQRLHGRRPRQAGPDLDDPRRRSRASTRPRSASRRPAGLRPRSRCPRASRKLHERKLHRSPVLIGGAAINRNFGLRILCPNGTESDDTYEPGVFYCKDAFEKEGWRRWIQLVDPEGRGRR